MQKLQNPAEAGFFVGSCSCSIFLAAFSRLNGWVIFPFTYDEFNFSFQLCEAVKKAGICIRYQIYSYPLISDHPISDRCEYVQMKRREYETFTERTSMSFS